MASVTVRGIDDSVKQALKDRAARRGRSLEAELRDALTSLANTEQGDRRNMAERIRARVAPFGGVELTPFPRHSLPPPLKLDE